MDLNANETLSVKNWFSYHIHTFFWLYNFFNEFKATVAIGGRPRMQIKDHPFRWRWAIKSIFLIAIKVTANQSRRRRNCPCVALKFKSLFYKERSFSPVWARRQGISRRTKGKGRQSKEHFQKKVLASGYNARKGESRECRSSHIVSAKIPW